MKQLILGGTRSGKSDYAQKLSMVCGQRVVYIATALAGDAEMLERIQQHKSRRPKGWLLIEEPYHLGEILQQQDARQRCMLVDSLTTWVENLMATGDEKILQHELKAFLETLPELQANLVMISDDVGNSFVSDDRNKRRMMDILGILNQHVVTNCDRVLEVTAGLPKILKDRNFI